MSDLYIDNPNHPDNQFYTPAEKVADYHYWLGRFVTDFANTEALLRQKCAQAAEIPTDITGIVFGELTARLGKERLTSILRARNTEIDEGLEAAMRQFVVIAEVRNAILHKGVDFDELQFVTKAGMPNSRRSQYVISADTLKEMTTDLLSISFTLILAIPTDETRGAIQSGGVRSLARAPWLYKHVLAPTPKERS